MTQTERILRRLNMGPMSSMEPLEWEPRIVRVAARIKDLRDQGYRIETTQAKNHVVYTLQTQAQGELF